MELSDPVDRRTPPAEEKPQTPDKGDSVVADVIPLSTASGAVASETDLRNKGNSDLVRTAGDLALPTGFPGVTLQLDGFEPLRSGTLFKQTNFEAQIIGASAVSDATTNNKNIKTDNQGRVTEVTYPDGRTRQFGYDPISGEMNRIVQPNGQVYVLQDGKWGIEGRQKLGNGNTSTPNTSEVGPGQPTDSGTTAPARQGELGAGMGSVFGTTRDADLDFKNPKVAADGTFTYEKNDGSKVKVGPDGGTETTTKDGAIVRTDSKDRVVEVRYTNGDSRTFSYDSTGKLKSYTENGQTFRVKELGEVYGPDGKFTGLKNPMIGKDGSFTVTDAQSNIVTTFPDRTSSTAKGDGSFVTKNADGQVTEVAYPDGRKATFGYDDRGRLNKITDANGKTYDYKATFDLFGIRFGSFKAQDGSTIDNVSVKADGTLQYTDQNGKIHNDFTSGNQTTTDKTEAELRSLAQQMHETNWFFTTNSGIKDTLKGMSHADRVALDEQYKKMYGQSLTEKLRGQEWNPLKRGNVEQALDLLTESHLRTEVLKNFNRPEDQAKANKLIDDFRERAKKQSVPLNQMDDIQQRAIEELQKGGFPDDQLKKLEKTFTDKSPTLESLNTRYGVKYDEVPQPDGTTLRKYYVEGENGAKVPVLDTNSDDPKEVERKLKEWQDNKIKELEQKYNVELSRDGQTDDPLGKKVNLRSPNILELMALEEGLKKSEPSTTSANGKPILVQFAVEPTSSASAYVLPRPDGQQRILFEPIPREYAGLKGTILHEWAHNAEHNMEKRDKAAIDKWYADMGYRKVTVDGRDQWQFRDKEGNYWTQGPDQPWYGNWTRVDEHGKPLKPDGTPASGWDDPNAAVRSNQQMRDNAAVTPGSDKDYFNKPWEGGAESLRWYRSNQADRTRLYNIDPKNYEATKAFDQAELDSDPRYGKNPDGTSKFIRLPDGTVGANTPENRKAVADFEATLPASRAAYQKQQQQNQSPRPGGLPGLGGKLGGGKVENRPQNDPAPVTEHVPACNCGGH